MLGLNFSVWVAQQRDKPLLPAKLSELRLHLSDVRQSLHVAGQGVAVDQARFDALISVLHVGSSGAAW